MFRAKRYLLASIRNAMECYKFGFKGQNKRHSVTVIVPTINSAEHLDIVLEYYKRMGVAPVIFVDAKSTDDTFRVASRSCEHVHLVENPHGWVEGMIERISRTVPTGWALRVDDDELPSRAVLEMCKGDLSGIAEPVVSFPRRNCGLTRAGQFAFDGRSDEDHQFRLYRVNVVEYRSDIHSPAIFVDRNLSMQDPHLLIHFDWAVHSYEQRRSKVERYDRIATSAGDRFRKGILFEEDPELPGACVALNAPEFVPVAAAIANRFPRSCVL